MNNSASRVWLVIIFISIIIMWILEFNGTIDNILEKEQLAAKRKKQDKEKFRLDDEQRRMKLRMERDPATTFVDFQGEPVLMKEKKLEDVARMNNYYLNELEKARRVEPKQDSQASLGLAKTSSDLKEGESQHHHARDDEPEPLEPLRVYIDEDAYDRLYEVNRKRRQKRDVAETRQTEFEMMHLSRRKRQGTSGLTPSGGNNANAGSGSGNNATNDTSGADDFGSGQDDDGRQKCNPISKRGDKPASFEPNLPPCHVIPPPDIEPVPAHLYEGKLQFGDLCWSMTQVAEEQAKGIDDYPPETEPPELARGREVKYTDVNAGVERKASEIDANTCILSKGLECIESDETDEAGIKQQVHKCGCMTAFGGKPKERLQINGTCYIRADAGDLSTYFGDVGLPLPSGDTYDKNEWNPVKLLCAPGSVPIASHLWTGKRCTCRKGTTVGEDGICSSSVSIHSIFLLIGGSQLILTILTLVNVNVNAY